MQIPPADPRASQVTPDPGLSNNPVADVAVYRAALAACEANRATLHFQYEDVRKTYGIRNGGRE